MELNIVTAYDRGDEVKLLFTEYTELLIQNDKTFREYLAIQNYDEEISHLEIKYGKPEGRLYLLYVEKALAGCIGLRKINDTACEMKRLYIRPEFRGRQFGRLLAEKVIEEARMIGYYCMLLDTLPFLESAIHLYQKLGFYEIESYNDSPMDTSIYMRLDL